MVIRAPAVRFSRIGVIAFIIKVPEGFHIDLSSEPLQDRLHRVPLVVGTLGKVVALGSGIIHAQIKRNVFVYIHICVYLGRNTGLIGVGKSTLLIPESNGCPGSRPVAFGKYRDVVTLGITGLEET
jgi:hypothetical protein